MVSILIYALLIASHGLVDIEAFQVECSAYNGFTLENAMRMNKPEKDSKSSSSLRSSSLLSSLPTSSKELLGSSPDIITNCIELLAYYQSQGVDPQIWCHDVNNYHVCCATCQNYLNLNSGSCVDLAATYDCELKKQQGLCHLILGNNQPVYVFCAKTCGYCPHEPYLTCAKLAPNTCQMGQCVDVRLFDVPTIKCVCPQSRGGAYCQIKNPCLSNPCQNGGICTAQYETPSGSYTCQCPVGYSGAQCQIFDQCYSIYCLNGGYCKLNYVGVPYCECPSGFYGTFCENSVGSCTPNPCLNNGQCLPVNNNDFKCVCQPNFSGKTCNYYIAPALCNRGDIDPQQCAIWKKSNLCNFIYVYQGTPIPLYCPHSCDLCKSYPPCIDTNPNCPTWANFGLCPFLQQNYPDMCRKSCNCC